MATLSVRYKNKSPKRGVQSYQITLYNGKSVSLPARLYSETAAQNCRVAVNCLERDLRGCSEDGSGSFSPATKQLLSERPDLVERLKKAGVLAAPRETTVGELWATYFAAKRNAWKGSTSTSKGTSRKKFFDFFPPETPVGSIGAEDARRFVDWLDRDAPNRQTNERGVSEATRAGTVRDARAVWNWGLQNGLIERKTTENETRPFNAVERGSYRNKSRDRYVTKAEYRRLLDACPDCEWRVIVALCRIAGLRNPSETLALRWDGIDWERSEITFDEPKNDRRRTIPLFPEVRVELEALKRERDAETSENSETGQEREDDGPFVLRRYRASGSNMRTTFNNVVVFRAGLEKFDAPFQNLRKSAATDLRNACGAFAESQWLGHSVEISDKHYQQISPDVWERAKTTPLK